MADDERAPPLAAELVAQLAAPVRLLQDQLLDAFEPLKRYQDRLWTFYGPLLQRWERLLYWERFVAHQSAHWWGVPTGPDRQPAQWEGPTRPQPERAGAGGVQPGRLGLEQRLEAVERVQADSRRLLDDLRAQVAALQSALDRLTQSSEDHAGDG